MRRPSSASNVYIAACAVVSLSFFGMTPGHADDAAEKVPSKRQLMKECMAKQKASDAGMPKEQMKSNCRDVTATQRENDKVEKKTDEDAAATAKK